MNKKELIDAVATETGMTKKDVGIVLEATFDVISDELAQDSSVSIFGFGKFDVRNRAARKGRNPQTGEEIEIPASKVPAFKAGKQLKEVVNN